jgi:hypothetical protein
VSLVRLWMQILSAGCSITEKNQQSLPGIRQPSQEAGDQAAKRDETHRTAPHTPIVLGVAPLSGHGVAAWSELGTRTQYGNESVEASLDRIGALLVEWREQRKEWDVFRRSDSDFVILDAPERVGEKDAGPAYGGCLVRNVVDREGRASDLDPAR